MTKLIIILAIAAYITIAIVLFIKTLSAADEIYRDIKEKIKTVVWLFTLITWLVWPVVYFG